MYCTRRINDDYTWVGADGRRLAMFEGVFDVPAGISFNSYLLRRSRRYFLDVDYSILWRSFGFCRINSRTGLQEEKS